MTYQLRQYQQEAVDAGVDFLLSERKRNGLIVLPCGSGKSLVIANIAQQLDGPCLVFQPGREILQQNLAKFKSYGYNPAVFSASMGRRNIGDITLATIGSVKNRAHLFEDFPYVLVDECSLVDPKKGMYRDFFKALGNVKICGFDATPFRLSTSSFGTILKFLTRTRPRVFDELIYYAQNSDLYDEGFLMKPEYHEVKGFNRHALRANSTGADYTDKSVQMHFDEINFKDKVVKVVDRLMANGRKNCLVFTRFVEEAEYVANRTGAAIVTADTPTAERQAILEEFKRGNIRVAVNVGVLGVGFDFPELETVVLARPTMSLRIFVQQVGRCVRTAPGKESTWVVDMVSLVPQFGKIENLTLVDGGNGKWYYADGDRPLTNVYFDSGGSRCKQCGASIGFWARHWDPKTGIGTGNSAPIQRPPAGIPANVAIHSRDGKTLYSIVTPGEGEFITHYAVCGRQQQMRATG
jgi:DNA repair protein RadD